MPGPVFLAGDRVDLHTVEEDDLPFLQETINDPAVRRHLRMNAPINAAQEESWFEEMSENDADVSLMIVADDETVGTIGLNEAPGMPSNVEIGLFLAQEYWGLGYGTEASRILTDYAFDERRYHRVFADVYDPNDASKAIWERLGYRHETVEKEAAYHDGEYVDVHRYAVLEHEWRD